ncbi:MAG: hypothetical protein EOP84_14900 [Verrucomicrobiaceae bacterium]|nr:MAG: hypothetical protein EOP84_14900 [Verrucomicrobiaceae bacterium]
MGKKPPVNGGSATESSWVRAENIVALVLLPKLPERDRVPRGSDKLDLAPEYEYDSRPADSAGRPLRKESIATEDYGNQEHRKQFNQLPPVVQVVMVAIDEPSAIRQQAISGEDPPEWTKDLFKTCKKEGDLLRDLGDPVDPQDDTLLHRLGHGTSKAPRMEYRIYSADVVLRGAKWTTVD